MDKQTTRFIYVVIISSLFAISHSMRLQRLLGCFGCCGGCNKKTKVHRFSGFDHRLQPQRNPLAWAVNYSRANQLTPGDLFLSRTLSHSKLSQLFNKTMNSTTATAQPATTNHTKVKATSTNPAANVATSANVTWFDIDSHLITQNSATIKSNMNIYLINMIMYDMTHVLYFLGHYLPLNNTAIATQFQMIFDYFAQFQYGVNPVNLRNVVKNYESIRQKALNLSLLLSHQNELNASLTLSIPTHIVDFDANNSLSKIYRHRKRMRKHRRERRVKTMTSPQTDIEYSDSAISSRMEHHFWNTDWLKWDKEPLLLNGLHPKEIQNFNEILLLRVCFDLDKVHKILTGYDHKGSGINSVKDLLKIRKAEDVFLKNFYNESASVDLMMYELALQRLFSLEDKQKKLLLGLRYAVTLDVINFVLLSSTKKAKRGQRKFRLHIQGIRSTQTCYTQIQFDVDSLGGYKRWKRYMMTINRYLKDILGDKAAAHALNFHQIQNNGGVLFLLNVVLQYARVGGKCGYVYNEKDTGYQASIVCQVCVANINEEGSNQEINEKLNIPRKFMEKGIDSDNYWVVLKDFTGLNFQDIEDETVEDEYHTTHRQRRGFTMEDLQRHNQEMERNATHQKKLEFWESVYEALNVRDGFGLRST